MIQYVEGDATQPEGDGPKVIVHCCNDIGAWGAGFVVALSRRWEMPERSYRAWASGDPAFGLWPFDLGAVQFVTVQRKPKLVVANLIGQRDVRPDKAGRPPIRYPAIGKGMLSVAAFAREIGATIHMPRMGAGLAGGDWDAIATIVDLACPDLSVTVYDLPQPARGRTFRGEAVRYNHTDAFGTRIAPDALTEE